MLEQTAEVVEIVPEGVWVRAVESSGCGTCGGQGCSTRRIAELFRRTPRGFLVESALPLSRGDRIVIGIRDGSVLSGALRAYGWPLFMMLAGALVARFVMPGDGPAIAGLVVGGTVGWLVARGGRVERPVVLRHAHTLSVQLQPYK